MKNQPKQRVWILAGIAIGVISVFQVLKRLIKTDARYGKGTFTVKPANYIGSE